jgi:hypothetical protein
MPSKRRPNPPALLTAYVGAAVDVDKSVMRTLTTVMMFVSIIKNINMRYGVYQNLK